MKMSVILKCFMVTSCSDIWQVDYGVMDFRCENGGRSTIVLEGRFISWKKRCVYEWFSYHRKSVIQEIHFRNSTTYSQGNNFAIIFSNRFGFQSLLNIKMMGWSSGRSPGNSSLWISSHFEFVILDYLWWSVVEWFFFQVSLNHLDVWHLSVLNTFMLLP